MSANKIDLDAMEARAKAATEGPWDYSDCEGELSVDAGSSRTRWNNGIGRPPSSWKSTDRILEHELETWDIGEEPDDDQRRADAEFIAHARTDVPALVGTLRRLNAALTELTHHGDLTPAGKRKLEQILGGEQ